VSTVDQRFAQSTALTSTSTSQDRQQHHVSPFHVGPLSSFGANHGFMSAASVHRTADDQPLDLTGAAARKRRGTASPSPLDDLKAAAAADADSPLDLSVKRARTDDAPAALSSHFRSVGADHGVATGTRGGLAMCGGGVVANSPLRSVHVARSPVPLAQLHAACHQMPAVDAPRLGVGVGAVPVIRRASSTAFHGSRSARGSRTCGGQVRPSSRMINEGARLSNARHARDVTVVVNGHRPSALVGAGTKNTTVGSRADVVRPAFTRIEYAADRRVMDVTSPGQQGYPDNAEVTVLGVGRSPVEPLVAGSPTSVSSLSVCSAYVTPPPVRPNAVHCASLVSASRRLDPRPKVLPTLAPFPESSSSLMAASHPVTLVDRLDPTESYPSANFLPPNVVASPALNDLDGRGAYFGERQSSSRLNVSENSGGGALLRAEFATPVWNTSTIDAADTERTMATKSVERSSAFGGLSSAENCVSEADVVKGDGASTIVAERNFGVTSVVDFVERQRACSSTGGSLLGHLTGIPRRVPVANVQPIMKDSTKMTTVAPPQTLSTSCELSGLGRRLSPVVDNDACSQMSATTTSTSLGRPLEAPAPAKDVTALLAAGLSRGGRVSSHHMEYVKFLSQSVDDAASLASPSVAGGALGHPRSTADRRRGSSRGGLAGLSAKARRQLLPYFHHDDQRQQPAAAVADKVEAIAACSSKSATNDVKVTVSAGRCTTEHGTYPSSSTSSATAGRKTTPIVYFDDDESTETSSSVSLTSGPEPIAKHWRQGASVARKPTGKPRKTARTAVWNVDCEQPSLEAASDGKQGVVSKRRKRVTGVKNSRVNEQGAGDDDLTDFEDARPSTSTQVSILPASEINHVSHMYRVGQKTEPLLICQQVMLKYAPVKLVLTD